MTFNRRLFILLPLLSLSFFSCAPSHVARGPEITEGLNYTHFAPELSNEEFKTSRENSILVDSHFRNGFALQNQDTAKPHVVKCLDYGGKRDTSFKLGDQYMRNKEINDLSCYWCLAPWWAPEECSHKTDECFEEDYCYKYRNPSRELIIDPVNGSLTMAVNACYENLANYGRKTIQDNENWSHALIQQNYFVAISGDCQEIHITFDINFGKLDYLGDNDSPQGNECAQFMIYFSPVEVTSFEPLSIRNDMWYGIPVLDTRYDYIEFYANRDFVGGVEGRLIYNMPSNLYMGKDKIKTNHTYHVDVDILNIPNYNLKDAYRYSYEHNYFKIEPNVDNIAINYINLGWEIPGPYDVSATISNLDIYTIDK